MKTIYCNIENTKNTNSLDDEYYNIENQLNIFTSFCEDMDFSGNKTIKKEICKKMSSYKSQDKKNGKYDEKQHITYPEIIQKLKESNLRCYYCNNKLFLMYKTRGEPLQWSLERFNNNIGHYKNNTCISCLKCNLQRRTSNHEYFKFSKNLSIVKV